MTSRAAANRYARALFDVAQKEADIQQVSRELAAFVEVFSGHELLSRTLSNPAIPTARKRAVVEQLLARFENLSPITSKLFLLLADRDRLVLVPDIATAYDARVMDHAQVVRAQLTTAVALPDDRVAALQQGLAKATGRQVQLETTVDPSIIGGAVARIGSTVYDGSVTMQLQKMKERLVSAAIE
ncbi:MAG TPA: ATP synthase F1 subunit delta [Vicinamibacterales bacterium]|nr:ATP synthase F1 subunit delta [Vicinamibacterales bacterium]